MFNVAATGEIISAHKLKKTAEFTDSIAKPITITLGANSIPVDIGDPLYFDDCSWTVSYDPKAKAWLSFHDWHPELALPSINHFFTTKTTTTEIPQCPPGYTFNSGNGMCEIGQSTNQISTPASYDVSSFYRHNVRCDSFVNYYENDYPWEIDIITNTGQAVNTVRSFEYQLETYVYKGEALYNMCGGDKWEDLNYNFDSAIVYNNDQTSGLLILNQQPFNDPILKPGWHRSGLQLLWQFFCIDSNSS